MARKVTPKTTVEEITPAKAKRILAKNKNNRRVRPSVVKRYARQMLAGEWGFTHQGAAIDFNGDLIDAQHRLMAIVESGVTVRMLVTRGLPPTIYSKVDTLSQRTGADCIGGQNAQLVSSILGIEFSVSGPARRPDNGELLLLRDRNPDVQFAAHCTHRDRAYLRGWLAPRHIGWVYMRARRIDTRMADQFFSDVVTGSMVAQGSPAFLLRERLQGRSTAVGTSGANIVKLLCLAWHHHCNGTAPSFLRVSTDNRAEAFRQLPGPGMNPQPWA